MSNGFCVYVEVGEALVLAAVGQARTRTPIIHIIPAAQITVIRGRDLSLARGSKIRPQMRHDLLVLSAVQILRVIGKQLFRRPFHKPKRLRELGELNALTAANNGNLVNTKSALFRSWHSGLPL